MPLSLLTAIIPSMMANFFSAPALPLRDDGADTDKPLVGIELAATWGRDPLERERAQGHG